MPVFEATQLQRLGDIASHQIVLGVTGQFEHPVPNGQDAALPITCEEPCQRGREEVLQDLEHVAEAAMSTPQPLVRKTLEAIVIDRPRLTVGANPVSHRNPPTQISRTIARGAPGDPALATRQAAGVLTANVLRQVRPTPALWP